MAATGQSIWQILPLGPTGYGDSPYQCFSAMAGNPLLISPDRLCEQGLLSSADLQNLPEFPLRVDFGWVTHTKPVLLRRACENFQAHATPDQQKAFEQFCWSAADWLEDYACFRAIKDAHNGESWHKWDPEIAQRKPAVLESWKQRLTGEIYYHKFLQFIFSQQWSALKTYANQKGIQILGDLPIYVAHDSAEVWAHPEFFHLDEETGEAALMAGVPPDYFSVTGQLWGNPIYQWERMETEGFSWWLRRFEVLFQMVDLVRIDHFRGFQAYWAVEQGETTAVNGKWYEAPGEALFNRIQEKLGKLPIIAEDLGFITPEVEALRDQFGFPGMKILQFAFDSGSGNPYLPFNYSQNCVVYTGTHDNDTTVGWFNHRSPEQQSWVTQYLNHFNPEAIHWNLIRMAFGSVANQAIIPLQDLLGLGSEARMNSPSTEMGNWGWRYANGILTDELGERLKRMTAIYGRLPDTDRNG
jgi:4-alpha-glucanotransferase